MWERLSHHWLCDEEHQHRLFNYVLWTESSTGWQQEKKKNTSQMCVSVSSYICQSVTELSGLTAILAAVPLKKIKLIGILNNFLFLYSQFSLIPFFFPSHPFIPRPSTIWNPIIACYWAVPGIKKRNIPFICFNFCSSDIFSKVSPSLFISLVFFLSLPGVCRLTGTVTVCFIHNTAFRRVLHFKAGKQTPALSSARLLVHCSLTLVIDQYWLMADVHNTI